MKKKIFCFDIDNVICRTKGKNYTKAKPLNSSIKLINQLYDSNHTIKLFTARYMGRNNDNVIKAKKQGYTKTFKQLKKWGVKFHILKMGKPSFDLYIDDKAYGYNLGWRKTIKKYIR